MQQMAEQDFVPCEAYDQAAVATLLSTAAAFHRWKQARLKASFKKQLSEILEDIDSEQHATKKLKQQVKKSRAREAELLEQLSDLQTELSSTNAQISQQHADIHEYTTAVDALEAHAAALEQRAAAAEATYAAERGRSTALQQQQQRELQEAKQEQHCVLQQQQALMDSLAHRDQQMAQLAAELKVAKTTAATAAQQLLQMEGVVQATGIKAAAAEDGLRTSTDLIVALQQQLAEMTDRYHTQLEQLRPLRAAASESAALKDRLSEASAAAAALAAGRDAMQRQLDAANAALAAATEQQRQLERAAGIQETITEAGFAGDLVGVLSQHLDNAQAKVAALAPRLAASEAVVQQQQRHIQQLAADLDRAQHARSAAVDRGDVLQVLNVQLQTEVKRLAALAGVPIGDWTGTVTVRPTDMRQTGDQATGYTAISTALILSQLQESLDTLDATGRSMARSKPKVTAAAKQATSAAAAVNQISTQLQQVIGKVQQSHTQQQQQEPAVLVAVVVSSRQQIVAVLEQQVQQVNFGLEEMLLHLQQEQQRWQHVITAAAAASEVVQQYSRAADTEDTQLLLTAGVEPEYYGSLKSTLQQLQAAESQLSRVLHRSGSSSCGDLSDKIIVTAESAARDISAMLLELSRLLEGYLAGNPPAKGPAAGDSLDNSDVSRRLEVAAVRASEKLQVIQSCYVSVSSSLAELSSVTAYLHAAQQQATAATSQLEQLQHLLQAQAETAAVGSSSSSGAAVSRRTKHPQQQHEPTFMDSSGDLASDSHTKIMDETIAALEVEVAALRLQLQRREVEVQQLMTREKHLLSGTAELIPAAMLSAARSQQDDLTAQVAALQQQLQQQAAAQQYAAEVYVDRVVARYKVQRLVEAWLIWRLAAAQGRADRTTLELSEAQASLQHAVEQQQQRSAAVADLLKRQVRAAGEQQQQQMAAAVIAAWQRQAMRQVHATWLWRGLSELLLHQHKVQASSYHHHHHQQQQQGLQELSSSALDNPATSISKFGSLAAAIVRRKKQPQGSCLWSVEAAQLLSLVFGAWRSFAQLESKTRVAQQKLDYAEQLSAGLPAWIQQIGDKRRLERAWLAWRLATVTAATARVAAAALPAAVHDGLIQQEQQQQQRIDRPGSADEQDYVTHNCSTVETAGDTARELAGPAAARNVDLDTRQAIGQLHQNPNSSSSILQQPWPPDGEALAQPPAAAAIGANNSQVSHKQQIIRAAAGSPASAAAAGVANSTNLDGRGAGETMAAPAAGPVRGQRSKSVQGSPPASTQAPGQQQQQERPVSAAGSVAATSPNSAAKVSRSINQNRKQQLSLRGGNRSSSTEVKQHGRSPPAGLSAAKVATAISKPDGFGSVISASKGDKTPTKVISSPSKVTPVNALLTSQAGAVFPGTTSHSRAAFGRTVKSGDWAPAPSKRSAAAAAAADRGSSGAGRGTASSPGRSVAGLADRRAVCGQETVGVKQQQQGGSAAAIQPGPAELPTAGAAGGPAASNVMQHLAAITSSLAVMQQQVQTSSRSIFQKGADALHPVANVDEVPQTTQHLQQQQQQQQQQLPPLLQPVLPESLTAGQIAAGGTRAPRSSKSSSSRRIGDLQQQLEGCQQNLQQITSSLRVASRPWLYSGPPQTDELSSPRQAAAAGEEAKAAQAKGGGSLSGHQQAASSTGCQLDNSTSANLASSACSKSSTAASARSDDDVSLAALLAAAAAAGKHKQSCAGNDVGALAKASAGVTGTKSFTAGAAASLDRARSPSTVLDTRSPQVATVVVSSPSKYAGSMPNSPLRASPESAAAGGGGGAGSASPEWHVVGQPRKTLLLPAAGAGLRASGDSGELGTSSVHRHTTDVPVTTYIQSHSSTPGPGSPPKARQQSPPPHPAIRGNEANTTQQPASTNSSHGATAIAQCDHASPVPQIASNVPQPYRPAEVVERVTVHGAQPQVTQLDGQQRSSAGVKPGVLLPEAGVVRFERINR